MPLEIEAKFLVTDFAPIQAKLQGLGYVCTKPRTLMQRRTYTLKEKAGATMHEWARVRDEGDKITMTYKHTHNTDNALGTEEIDLTVNDFTSANAFMQRLGFMDFLTQETYRETWERYGVQVTCDEWPVIGRLVEVEAPSEDAVKASCEDLGFDYSQALFGGVGSLYYAKYGKDMGLVRELTFAKAPEVEAFLKH